MLGVTLDEEELLTACKNRDNIYIYGAGRNGDSAYRFLKARGISVKGFIVSRMQENPACLFGKDVMVVDDFKEDEDSLIIVLVPSNDQAYREIYDTLVGCKIHQVYFVPRELLRLITAEGLLWKNREVFNIGEYCLGEDVPVEAEYGILVQKGADGEEYHWRFPIRMAREQAVNSVDEIFACQSAKEEFEGLYGKYNIFLTAKTGCAGGTENYAVYMACSHVDQQIRERKLPAWVVPIQVGAFFTDADICKVKDCMGENISERNGNYSECTAVYWMWKNAPRVDYIGLCHYRRLFALSNEEIKGIAAQGVDVLLTSPSFVMETVETFFSALVPKSDMQVMMGAIRRVCPEYLFSAEHFLTGRFYPPCNLFVMRYEIFKEYGAFVFAVTFEIERVYDEAGIYRKDRYMGFIMECLLGIFVMKHKDRLKVAYTDMKFDSVRK